MNDQINDKDTKGLNIKSSTTTIIGDNNDNGLEEISLDELYDNENILEKKQVHIYCYLFCCTLFL